MKTLKKSLMLITILALIFSMSAISASAATTPAVSVDGAAVTFSADLGAPYIDSANRTQIPIRAVSEKLGYTVTWDQATQTATIDGNIKIKQGDKVIRTPYGQIAMDTVAVNNNGRIYVPARFVVNALGYDIEATSENGTIKANIITKADLVVSAAASLKAAMDEAVTAYKAEKPNTTLSITYGGSGTLKDQIINGAPVDLFFSADEKNMNALKDQNLLLDGSVKNLLKNKLVLIVTKGSNVKATTFADVPTSGIKTLALGTTGTVPAGDRAAEVFAYYKVTDAVKAMSPVYAKDVTEVRTWVESGNADAGVVYLTDAKLSGDKVQVIATAPDATHAPVIYPAGIVKSSKQPAASQAFINFLTTDKAKTIFEKYGFSVAE